MTENKTLFGIVCFAAGALVATVGYVTFGNSDVPKSQSVELAEQVQELCADEVTPSCLQLAYDQPSVMRTLETLGMVQRVSSRGSTAVAAQPPFTMHIEEGEYVLRSSRREIQLSDAQAVRYESCESLRLSTGQVVTKPDCERERSTFWPSGFNLIGREQ
ncbi:MAG TPA: hypothetical protein VKP88_01485 [Candidatus Paceibacterota bacterium]|nr:hypothetical protein [Candidatus Paceibacterota bacterium]